jgi:hypothetical protein
MVPKQAKVDYAAYTANTITTDLVRYAVADVVTVA